MKNFELLEFFNDDKIKNVFPLYILDQHPLKESLSIEAPNDSIAAAVNGLMYGNFEVFSYWLKAPNEKGLKDLLIKLANDKGSDSDKYINCDIRFRGLLEGLDPALISELDTDLHFMKKPGSVLQEDLRYQLIPLDVESLPKLDLSQEIKAQIGSFNDFPVGSRFWGLLDGGEVVALADGLVNYDDIVSISQVYTLKSKRGQGLGKEVVSRVTNLFNSKNCTVTYLVSQSNTHSVNLVKGLGFELYNEFCFAKVPSKIR